MQYRGAIAFGSVIALAACSQPEAPVSFPPFGDHAARPKTAPTVEVAAAILESPAPIPIGSGIDEASAFPNVEMEKSWQGFGVPKCSYLAPKGDFVADDGAVDVVFHFHAGQMSEREMRESGVRGVFVSCGYGMGTGGYSSAFEDPKRFGWMMRSLTRTIGTAAKRSDVHLRHLALASWSAGFAAVSRILAVPEWYEATDTVLLFDSLHAQYVDPTVHAASQGADRVDVKMLRRFVRFATDAAAGKKTMLITHSSIVPPDYASTTEATAALLFEVGVIPMAVSERNDGAPRLRGDKTRPMALSIRADEGGLHVRGFRGTGPHDHFDHLHLIGEALRSWLVPRWYTPAGERR